MVGATLRFFASLWFFFFFSFVCGFDDERNSKLSSCRLTLKVKERKQVPFFPIHGVGCLKVAAGLKFPQEKAKARARASPVKDRVFDQISKRLF